MRPNPIIPICMISPVYDSSARRRAKARQEGDNPSTAGPRLAECEWRRAAVPDAADLACREKWLRRQGPVVRHWARTTGPAALTLGGLKQRVDATPSALR